MPEPAELARRLEVTERRLADARSDARTLAATNQKLNATLVTARDALDSLRAEVAALGQPPNTFGYVVGTGDGTIDVATNGRWLRCALSPDLADQRFVVGDRVLLNEAQLVVGIANEPGVGETARLVSTLPESPLRLLVTTATGEETVVLASTSLNPAELRPGTPLLVDRRAGLALVVLPNNEVADLTLEDVPDVSYADIGGLSDQIEQIRDAVELPFRHRELFAEFGLRPPKGVLLYGPPGCGKTMIAKAVANSAGSHFLNIKGPELLNKYVGETERQIRAIFTRAKEHATSGRPVIVFFDEMDALFRTRGSGVSSDVEATVVPQLLAEIDGVEDLANVIVIGATNREDLIDPAILRPGRLDVKIKLDRPDRSAAAEILARYLTEATPLNPGEAALRQAQGSLAGTQGSLAEPVEARTDFREQLIDAIVDRLFARTDANRFIEVTYAGGDKETLYVGDFVSGAMLAGVVDRAKKAAIKELINGGERGVRLAHVEAACAAEIGENEELPNTTNPDDWARVSGRKGERIVFLRTLVGARALNP
ncbi:MAG TPA: proteasome ATPase [Propionicimonas sp.]|nr:proteasome ATPase [Propionicimonas sp.]HQA77045.1 proteasome ATPase [Propionicimonas sp.]HQD96175.1 proteasome ATPase [Propionicimonas sp.]